MLISLFKASVLMLIAGGFITTAAEALTIPSGSVITPEGDVVPVEESANTQRAIEYHGYAFAAGKLVVGVGEGAVVAIPVSELAGQSGQRIKEIIVERIIESGFTEDGIQFDYVEGDEAARAIAEQVGQEVYQEAVEAAVLADNIANGVAEDIAREAASGFSFDEFCADPNATGDKSGC